MLDRVADWKSASDANRHQHADMDEFNRATKHHSQNNMGTTSRDGQSNRCCSMSMLVGRDQRSVRRLLVPPHVSDHEQQPCTNTLDLFAWRCWVPQIGAFNGCRLVNCLAYPRMTSLSILGFLT